MHHTDHSIPSEPRQLPENGAFYFVGIGGAGMSAIAQVLAERGRTILGADPGISARVKERLETVGATVYTAHDAANVGADVSAVVVSDAIPQANPEVIAAKERGIPIYRRPEVLGAIVNAGRGIAIAGTHGQTTTTGMVASILMAAGLDPTVLIGGDLPLIGGNARNGKGDFVVAESCEAYDGFLYLHPEVAVILNVEADHLAYHGDEAHVIASFERFLSQIKPEGAFVACIEDEKTRNIFLRFQNDLRQVRAGGYALSRVGDGIVAANIFTKGLSLEGGSPYFEFFHFGVNPDTEGSEITVQGKVRLAVPGRHNVLNALAAIGAGIALNIDVEHIVAGLESFTGTGRRFERLGEVNGVTVIDDYAHHPTELRATLSATRSAFPNRRIVAVFQPHLPSRTRDLMAEFAEALANTGSPLSPPSAGGERGDAIVYLTDIYLAREQPLPGISSETLAQKVAEVPGAATVVYVSNKSDLPARLAAEVRPGDVVITLGAGDIRAAGEELLTILKSKNV